MYGAVVGLKGRLSVLSHLCEVPELGKGGKCLNVRFLSVSTPFSQHSDLNIQAKETILASELELKR